MAENIISLEQVKEESGMTEEEMVQAIAEGLDEFDEIIKPSKKDLAKLFASGFVAGCSGVLVGTWMRPLKITLGGPEIVDKIVNSVGMYGIQAVVTSKVMHDTHESLDAVDELIQIQKLRRKAKKTLVKAQKAKKEKYIEVKEG